MLKLTRGRKHIHRVIAVSVCIALLSTPASAQVCGDANGDGQYNGADLYHLFDYLIARTGDVQGDAGDVDSYENHTLRDVLTLTWNLVHQDLTLVCPATRGELIPRPDTTSYVIYDEIFPAGKESVQLELILVNSDTVGAFTLPFRVRVDGIVPSFGTAAFGPQTGPFDLKKIRANMAEGEFLFGAISFSRETGLPPGSGVVATVELSMPSVDYDREIGVEWIRFSPIENGQGVNVATLLNKRLDAVRPGLAGDCSTDQDLDGVVDCLDRCPGFDDRIDADGDGVGDLCDVCPGFDDRADADFDDIPDGCDQCPGYDDRADADGDGIPDCLDLCTDTDHDGYGDPGFPFNTCEEDNCAGISNILQSDTDSDRFGDPCDICPEIFNPGQTDSDDDGAGDECDNCPSAFNPAQGDLDGDGYGNVCDADLPRLTPDARIRLTTTQGSDCWGWTAPDGTEYAFMGTREGIVVVQTDPSIRVIDTIPGPMGGNALWRDMKTYRHYLYSVSEQSGPRSGLGIADLQYLPDSVHYVGAVPTNGISAYTSHNISIDTARGFAYVQSQGARSVNVLSLAIPEAPRFAGSFSTAPVHDLYARNDTVFLAEGSSSSWSMWDLTNKASPHQIIRVTGSTGGYMHNIWPTADGNYVVTTEETFAKTVKVWDIHDLFGVRVVAEYLGPSQLAHNAHIQDDILYISHYESGVVALQFDDPTRPEELAIFDTYPQGESSGFNGCWGVYPHTRNGQIYASNIDGYLTILRLLPACDTRFRGDVALKTGIDLIDVIVLINHVLRGVPLPGPDEDMADVNCSGFATLADVILLVEYLYGNGREPCEVCD